MTGLELCVKYFAINSRDAFEYRLLTLTAPIVFGRLHIMPVVLEFLRAYPEVEVTLLLDSARVEVKP